MSDPKLPSYACWKCQGTEFHVNTSFGTPSRVLVTCRTMVAHAGEGLLPCHMTVGPSLTQAFEAISKKEPTDAPPAA